MDLAHGVLLAGASFAAGAINAAVGSGTLLTYPVLLGLGLPPVLANGTNTLGVVPGAISGAWVYRDKLSLPRDVLKRLGLLMAGFGVVGALLVVLLPDRVFTMVVPWLILAACAVILLQPVILRIVGKHNGGQLVERHSGTLVTVVFTAIGIYSGYFGAAVGVALLAGLLSLVVFDVQQANAAKNVLAGVGNGAAALVFIVFGKVVWIPALIMMVMATIGGAVGGGVARRLPAPLLRAVIIAVGLYAAAMAFAQG